MAHRDGAGNGDRRATRTGGTRAGGALAPRPMRQPGGRGRWPAALWGRLSRRGGGGGHGRRRLLAGLLACLAAVPLLAGCWDRVELEQLAFVTVLGIDTAPKPHELLVTFKIARPAGFAGNTAGAAGGGGGGGGSGHTTVTTTVEAPNVLSAETVASSFVGRRLTLVQNAAILIGLPLAKKGISPYLDEMARSRESRRTQLMLVCSPTAQAVIDQAQPPLDTNPVAFLDEIRRLRQTEGWIPHLSLQYFFGALQGTTADPVAGYNALQPQAAGKGAPKESAPPGGAPIGATGTTLPRTGKSPSDVFGAVAFRRSRAVGVLTGQQTVVLNMLQGNFRRSILTIPDPFDPRQYDNLIVTANHGPSVRIDTRGRIPSIRVQVPLEAAVESIGSSVDYALNAPSTARLQAAADGVLQRQAAALVAEAQHTWRADIFGFGNTARRNFLTDRALKAYHWLKVFPQARVRIRFNVQVAELGPQLAPPVPGKP